MLGGLEPVIIFQIGKLSTSLGTQIAKIPLLADIPTIVEQPPIPIYLSEQLTGLYVDTKNKNVDIETDTQTLSTGFPPAREDQNQKGISSAIEINLIGKKDSIGIILLSAMIDLVFEKVTSKEYSISFLHGTTTIFRGVLHSFSADENVNDELVRIRMSISKGTKSPTKGLDVPTAPRITGTAPIA